jgi:serine phosphatase RsbU (regulator of sigma subunit)
MKITVLSPKNHQQHIASLREVLGDTDQSFPIEVASGSPESYGSIVLVDSEAPQLEQVLSAIPRAGRSVFLLVSEKNHDFSWGEESENQFDDILIYPWRRLEVESKFRFHQHLRLWHEVSDLNLSFQELLKSLDDDVHLAERLQKAKLPVRFPEFKGLHIRSRYLAGMKSGGDHFDLADSSEGSRLSILLSDSSSYGLSSGFLSTLMRMTLKLSRDESRSSLDTVKLIYDELLLTLKEKDHLSLFYGILSRKDYSLKYLHLGTSGFFHAKKGEGFELMKPQAPALSASHNPFTTIQESSIICGPNDRLVLLSDGYMEACGGQDETRKFLDRFRDQPQVDLLNELTFRVKKEFKEEDDMPEQDCSAMVFDIDAKVLRLT